MLEKMRWKFQLRKLYNGIPTEDGEREAEQEEEGGGGCHWPGHPYETGASQGPIVASTVYNQGLQL